MYISFTVLFLAMIAVVVVASIEDEDARQLVDMVTVWSIWGGWVTFNISHFCRAWIHVQNCRKQLKPENLIIPTNPGADYETMLSKWGVLGLD